jgi:hypothetical protein
VIHFKTGTYSPSPAGRTLNQRLPFFYCGTIKSPPSRPYQYSEFGDAQAQFVAYSNDVSSVSKIALVGRNGLVVALAFDRNALIHGWACSTDGTRRCSQRLSQPSDQRERVVAAGGRIWRLWKAGNPFDFLEQSWNA